MSKDHALKATCKAECRESPNVEPCEKICQTKGIQSCVDTLRKLTVKDPNILKRNNADICKAIDKMDPKLQLGQNDWMVESVCSHAVSLIPLSGLESADQHNQFMEEFCKLGMMRRVPAEANT